MSKQTIEIEVLDGWKVVGYREPISGEYYLSEVSSSIRAASVSFTSKHIILDRDPDYVEAIEVRLKPGWVAMDSNRGVYWFSEKPTISNSVWVGDGGWHLSHFCDIDLGTDWKQSLRRVK